jgi:transcriptional regulator with XRE-family HTH domain
MTQAGLAARLGVSQPVIARLERPNANPTWETLVRALRATGHDVELTRRVAPVVEPDLAQLRERLALSPSERLHLFQGSQRGLLRLQANARRRTR